jgi:hypothetical protein
MIRRVRERIAPSFAFPSVANERGARSLCKILQPVTGVSMAQRQAVERAAVEMVQRSNSRIRATAGPAFFPPPALRACKIDNSLHIFANRVRIASSETRDDLEGGRE